MVISMVITMVISMVLFRCVCVRHYGSALDVSAGPGLPTVNVRNTSECYVLFVCFLHQWKNNYNII